MTNFTESFLNELATISALAIAALMSVATYVSIL